MTALHSAMHENSLSWQKDLPTMKGLFNTLVETPGIDLTAKTTPHLHEDTAHDFLERQWERATEDGGIALDDPEPDRSSLIFQKEMMKLINLIESFMAALDKKVLGYARPIVM